MHGEEKKTSLRQPGSLFAKKLLEGLSGVKRVSNLILVKPHPLPSNLKQQIGSLRLMCSEGKKLVILSAKAGYPHRGIYGKNSRMESGNISSAGRKHYHA
jgi:hypothetical protein